MFILSKIRLNRQMHFLELSNILKNLLEIKKENV